MKFDNYTFHGIHSSMPIGRYTCNVRGCIEAIEEINLRGKDGYKELLQRQISRGKLLLSLYEQIISQKNNCTISMKWFHIIKDDIIVLQNTLDTVNEPPHLSLIH